MRVCLFAPDLSFWRKYALISSSLGFMTSNSDESSAIFLASLTMVLMEYLPS
ncbi:MAG TPA: hypothetical protein VKU79_05810 [Thermoplasmataceae archaeon]|nr:hypothetical protein [Thermoplasmataceae archaeon]